MKEKKLLSEVELNEYMAQGLVQNVNGYDDLYGLTLKGLESGMFELKQNRDPNYSDFIYLVK